MFDVGCSMFFNGPLAMDDLTLNALRVTLQVATVATVIVLVPGTLAAYLLARADFPLKSAVSTLLGLPLVLPPTAVGFLLLELLSAHGILGRETLGFDLGILLTWKGAVLASATMSVPLVVGTARVTFEGIDPRLEQMARTLGHGPISTFIRYTLPLASRGLLAAAILGFSRAVGEFGATIIVAGNIPGRTQTLATAIFSAQQAGRNREAGVLLCVALLVGFVAIFSAEHLSRRRAAHRHDR
jgi:molybdate transport system permease protein